VSVTSGFGGLGSWKLASPAVNRPGVPLTPQFVAFLNAMAEFYDGQLTVTTGSAHSEMTADGYVSDHWFGNAADFGSAANGPNGALGGPWGERIAMAAYLAAGLDLATATQKATAPVGDYTRVPLASGGSVQVLWRVPDHFDHVHVGWKP
jgi:hypothetical protein